VSLACLSISDFPSQIAAANAELHAALHELSPAVEPAGEPGTFWLDGAGLRRIFGSPEAWAQTIAARVTTLGYAGAVVFGRSRFATYAIARARRTGVHVMASADHEREAAREVPLALLDIAPKMRDALARLGVSTLGQMVRLPGGGILERFGRDAHRIYQLAAGERWDPIVPVAPPERPDERVLLDDDIDDIDRLVFAIRGAIERLLARLAAKVRALTALHVELTLKQAVGRLAQRGETIVPAEPTLDTRLLVRLLHLRLSGAPLAAPVCQLRVWADDIAATGQQLALFQQRPRRDLRAADEALAHLRAELGEDAVVRAVLRDGHLPEARFGWERLAHVVPAKPLPLALPECPLVRRLRARPRPLPIASMRNRDDGWLLAGVERGAVVRLAGPHIVSGGWWAHEQPIFREYYFAEMTRGDCLWVYFDRRRYRWFEHGVIA
jgi:protein ImuB